MINDSVCFECIFLFKENLMVNKKLHFLSLIVLSFFCEVINIEAMLEKSNNIIETKPKESKNQLIISNILIIL